MGEGSSKFTGVLQREFPGSALGLIGCHSSGEAYLPCEYDYLVVSKERGFERRLINEEYIDIVFVDEEDLLNVSTDPLILALIDAEVISDPRWVLTPVVSRIKAEASKHLRSFARRVMFKSLSDLGRFQDALDAGNCFDASFWLQSSAYGLAAAFVAYRGSVPRGSHLLPEFRRVADEADGVFEIWSTVLGLNLASKVSVMRRLDAFRDLLQAGSGISSSPVFAELGSTYMLTEARSNYLLRSHAVADAYSYLGLELMRAVEELYEFRCISAGKTPVYQNMFSHLARLGASRGLSMQTVRLIGLSSDAYLLRDQGAQFNGVVRSVAKSVSKE